MSGSFTVLGDPFYFGSFADSHVYSLAVPWPTTWIRLKDGTVIIGQYDTFSDARTAALLAGGWNATAERTFADPLRHLELTQAIIAALQRVARYMTPQQWAEAGLQGARIVPYLSDELQKGDSGLSEC